MIYAIIQVTILMILMIHAMVSWHYYHGTCHDIHNIYITHDSTCHDTGHDTHDHAQCHNTGHDTHDTCHDTGCDTHDTHDTGHDTDHDTRDTHDTCHDTSHDNILL